MSGPTPHAQAFHCPYCAEQELRPATEPHALHCRACDRRFTVRYLGLGPGREASERAAPGHSRAV